MMLACDDFFKEKKILLIQPQRKFTFNDYKKFGYNVEAPYISENFLLRVAREVVFKCRLPFASFFYNKRIIKNNWDYIIIYDPLINEGFIDFITKNIDSSKIVFFLDNIVGKRLKLIKFIKNKGIRIATLDKNDAKKYNISLINNFYNIEYVSKEKKVIKYDVSFIGADKGRYNYLVELEKTLKKLNLRTYFYITSSRRYTFNFIKYKKRLSYKNIVNIVSESKAVLEILQNGQNSSTFRALESLFNNKKLITNNSAIKNYPFYNQQNIFIIGEDDINTLENFLNKPPIKIDYKVIEELEFKKVWAKFLTMKKLI